MSADQQGREAEASAGAGATAPPVQNRPKETVRVERVPANAEGRQLEHGALTSSPVEASAAATAGTTRRKERQMSFRLLRGVTDQAGDGPCPPACKNNEVCPTSVDGSYVQRGGAP